MQDSVCRAAIISPAAQVISLSRWRKLASCADPLVPPITGLTQ